MRHFIRSSCSVVYFIIFVMILRGVTHKEPFSCWSLTSHRLFHCYYNAAFHPKLVFSYVDLSCPTYFFIVTIIQYFIISTFSVVYFIRIIMILLDMTHSEPFLMLVSHIPHTFSLFLFFL